MTVPSHPQEAARLEALRQYHLLDTLPEQSYDDIVQLAASICEVPMAAVVLIDQDRQWFKARVGVASTQTPLEESLCAYAICMPGQTIVENASTDARFAMHPVVVGEPFVRFYVGSPLLTHEGLPLGTICVADTKPRTASMKQLDALQSLARQVVRLMELSKAAQELARVLETVRTLSKFIPLCAWCRRIRNEEGTWKTLEEYVRQTTGQNTSHGICPDCLKSTITTP
ncbi:MAG: GAF domain-containing protein [Gemmataceae bacterium]